MSKTEITVGDGKYTVCHEHGTNLRALRYGEPWRDLAGDGLVLALVHEIEALRAAADALAAQPAAEPASIHLQDLKNALAESKALRDQLRLMEEQAKGEVWRWQGDGTDNLDSMGARMGVLIYASNLKALIAAQPAAEPTCEQCGGTGEVLAHAENCHDDLCALNGDEHSCVGRVEPCSCAAQPARAGGDAFSAGVKAAADWISKRRADFIEAHGYTDPSTGALEFGRGARAEVKVEYVGELDEIEEGIRALASQACSKPPEGWQCTRAAGHEGPCAASQEEVSPNLPVSADWVSKFPKAAAYLIRRLAVRVDELEAAPQPAAPEQQRGAAREADEAMARKIAAEAQRFAGDTTHLGKLVYVNDLVWALSVLAASVEQSAVAEPVGHVKFVAHRHAPDVQWAAGVDIRNGAALYLAPPLVEQPAASTVPAIEAILAMVELDSLRMWRKCGKPTFTPEEQKQAREHEAELRRALVQLAAAPAAVEREALDARDAARYRWLRTEAGDAAVVSGQLLVGEKLDALADSHGIGSSKEGGDGQ